MPSPGGACARRLVALQARREGDPRGSPFCFPHMRSDAQLEKVQERPEAPPERERSSRASTRRNDAVVLTAAFACALSERGRAPGSKAPPDCGSKRRRVAWKTCFVVGPCSASTPAPEAGVNGGHPTTPGSSKRRGHRALNAEVEVRALVPELHAGE